MSGGVILLKVDVEDRKAGRRRVFVSVSILEAWTASGARKDQP